MYQVREGASSVFRVTISMAVTEHAITGYAGVDRLPQAR